MMSNDPQETAEQDIDKWRGGLCPTCQRPSPTAFCSEKCRRAWRQAYTVWLKSEGKYEPDRNVA